MITAILNSYRRHYTLKEQIAAIEAQTLKAQEIMIWQNAIEDHDQIKITSDKHTVVSCNKNFKFHGRFSLGLLAQTEYVAFFDDDTIPGPKWFENCIKTIDSGYDGILGAVGVRLLSDNYVPNYKIGWSENQKETVEEVDLVGHAWFMKKDYLRYMWYEEPLSWDNGEDIQLSYLAQKYGGVKTYVPPHPLHNQSVWGSKYESAIKYGEDFNASYKSSSHVKIRNEICNKYIKSDWKLVENSKE